MFIRYTNLKITARIPHQSPIGFVAPIGDSFPPGEAIGNVAPKDFYQIKNAVHIVHSIFGS